MASPSLSRLAPPTPAKQAVPGPVSTHWPTRFCELLLQLAAATSEQQDAHAGAAVRRLGKAKLAVDAGLAAAADDRGGKAGHA